MKIDFNIMNLETVNTVYSTSNYELFKTLAGNRAVSRVHIQRLKQSFKEAYLSSVMIVNEDFEIIDGQHRYEAAKSLGLPVNFIICKGYSLKEVQLLNTSAKNWTKTDYLQAYCDLGNEAYIEFRNFMHEYPDFGIAAAESILTNKLTLSVNRASKELVSDTNKSGKYSVKYFQNGELEIPDIEQSRINAEKIMRIKPHYDGFNRPVFVIAMLGIFRIADYNHDQLISRLESNPKSLTHCSNVTQYKSLIEEIYNFRSRNKVSLRF